jgi:hypothetical protein
VGGIHVGPATGRSILRRDPLLWALASEAILSLPRWEKCSLKSEIARPRVYETLAPNRIYTVFGAAWAGETDVVEIAVSTDGGRTWVGAEFLDPVQRHAWRRWKFDWLTPNRIAGGDHIALCLVIREPICARLKPRPQFRTSVRHCVELKRLASLLHELGRGHLMHQRPFFIATSALCDASTERDGRGPARTRAQTATTAICKGWVKERNGLIGIAW